jgi:hypothetical protein
MRTTKQPKLKIDTRVVVWDNSNTIKRTRYFSHFDDTGRIHTFFNGGMSWSSSDKKCASWDCWELAK